MLSASLTYDGGHFSEILRAPPSRYSANYGLHNKSLPVQPAGSGYAWDLLPIRLSLK